MRIFIDIGHPAHVHYFRNFITLMKEKNHEFLITARDKEFVNYLLNYYKINFTSRGKGKNNILGKIFYLVAADFQLFGLAKKFNPDIFMSFASSYAAHISKLLGKPHIVFDDTEHAKLEHLLYVPFSDCIITPHSFRKDFGDKHIRFKGTMDLAYLHHKYFNPNKDYLHNLNLYGKKYFLLRFVSWGASHDIGQNGFSDEGKYELIKQLLKFGQVLISSEKNLPSEMKKYRYNGDPAEIHTILKFAEIFISESGSMATEAAILGTPSVLLNSGAKYCGVFDYVKKFGNLFYFESDRVAKKKITELLNIENLKGKAVQNAHTYMNSSIDLTDFMMWFIENYPDSFSNIKKESEHYNVG